MDINIYTFGGDFDFYKVKWICAYRNQFLKSGSYCVVQVATFNKSAVGKEILFAFGLFSVFGFANKSFDTYIRHTFLDINETVVIVVPKKVHNSFLLVGFWKFVNEGSVVGERKFNVATNEGYSAKLFYDACIFGSIALQKVSTNRYVKE